MEGYPFLKIKSEFMKSVLFAVLSFVLMSSSCNNQKVIADQSPDLSLVKEAIQEKEVYQVSQYIVENGLDKYARATFAGGCFWCTEAAFHRIKGVVDVISGYSGGEEEYPTYKQVGYGQTGHAEAIEIFYDSNIVDFNTLLEVFYVAHDGTQLNRQGPDVGRQYRSAIYYKDLLQKEQVESYITQLESQKGIDIVTEIAAYDEFWVAEEYHQNFYELNPNQGYVVKVSRPKVEKVKAAFPELIKKEL